MNSLTQFQGRTSIRHFIFLEEKEKVRISNFTSHFWMKFFVIFNQSCVTDIFKCVILYSKRILCIPNEAYDTGLWKFSYEVSFSTDIKQEIWSTPCAFADISMNVGSCSLHLKTDNVWVVQPGAMTPITHKGCSLP